MNLARGLPQQHPARGSPPPGEEEKEKKKGLNATGRLAPLLRPVQMAYPGVLPQLPEPRLKISTVIVRLRPVA